VLVSSNTGRVHCKLQIVYAATYESLTTFISAQHTNLTSDSELISNSSPLVSIYAYQHIGSFLIATGGQEGEVKLHIYQTTTWVKQSLLKTKLDGPISEIILTKLLPGELDLVVVSSIGYAMIFEDVITCQLDNSYFIQTPCSDVLTSCLTIDIDFDGRKEIILGSYSGKIFCYKKHENIYQPIWEMTFEHPVMCICAVDINRDGIIEAIVVSLFGVTVLQPDLSLAWLKLQNVKNYLKSR
jgi:WD40 repeat protein